MVYSIPFVLIGKNWMVSQTEEVCQKQKLIWQYILKWKSEPFKITGTPTKSSTEYYNKESTVNCYFWPKLKNRKLAYIDKKGKWKTNSAAIDKISWF